MRIRTYYACMAVGYLLFFEVLRHYREVFNPFFVDLVCVVSTVLCMGVRRVLRVEKRHLAVQFLFDCLAIILVLVCGFLVVGRDVTALPELGMVTLVTFSACYMIFFARRVRVSKLLTPPS